MAKQKMQSDFGVAKDNPLHVSKCPQGNSENNSCVIKSFKSCFSYTVGGNYEKCVLNPANVSRHYQPLKVGSNGGNI